MNYRAALTTWRRLVELNDKLEQVLLDLFAHPDATPEQIELALSKLRHHREMMREGYAQMAKARPAIAVSPALPRFMEGLDLRVRDGKPCAALSRVQWAKRGLGGVIPGVGMNLEEDLTMQCAQQRRQAR